MSTSICTSRIKRGSHLAGFRELSIATLANTQKAICMAIKLLSVTRRVLAEGVWDGYFCISQKRPHSLDRENFTMIFIAI